jgi:hypothetical protein
MEMELGIGLTGPELPALLRALPGRLVPKTPPSALSVGYEPRRFGADWLEKDVLRGGETALAEWKDAAGHFLTWHPDTLVKGGGRHARDAQAVLTLLAGLPFTVASFCAIHPEWDAGEPPYSAPSFADLHFPHGWACAFRGEGHSRLVSRRWLDFGPWRVLRGAGDTTLVQFHDLGADAVTALAQAKPGHERMGISDTGGFIPPGHLRTHELRGLHDAKEGVLRIIVHGRDVSQEEMLDACSTRLEAELDGQPAPRRVAYVFMEPSRARAHLHELWLRELECWTVDLGREVRLDRDYRPTPTKPDWVKALSR